MMGSPPIKGDRDTTLTRALQKRVRVRTYDTFPDVTIFVGCDGQYGCITLTPRALKRLADKLTKLAEDR